MKTVTNSNKLKFPIGTKVTLLSKHNEHDNLITCYTYNRIQQLNQKYAYVIGYTYPCYIIYEKMIKTPICAGDFFLESDLKLDIQEERKEKLKKLKWIR